MCLPRDVTKQTNGTDVCVQRQCRLRLAWQRQRRRLWQQLTTDEVMEDKKCKKRWCPTSFLDDGVGWVKKGTEEDEADGEQMTDH